SITLASKRPVAGPAVLPFADTRMLAEPRASGVLQETFVRPGRRPCEARAERRVPERHAAAPRVETDQRSSKEKSDDEVGIENRNRRRPRLGGDCAGTRRRVALPRRPDGLRLCG